MAREEVHVLSQLRREELRRLREDAARRHQQDIVLRLGDIKVPTVSQSVSSLNTVYRLITSHYTRLDRPLRCIARGFPTIPSLSVFRLDTRIHTVDRR